MKKITLLILLCVTSILSHANNDRYRLVITDNPATTITIGWDQTSGSNPVVYYGTTDFGVNFNNYPFNKAVERVVDYKSMNNNFVKLTGLTPNTAYYFVINDSEGTSNRFWFKTAPDTNIPMSFIAGGDSRNNIVPRQNANLLVSKLKPTAVFFGGDMTSGDSGSEWIEWLNHWQLTTSSDGRMIPVIPARGNHEDSNQSIYNLFDTPSEDVYYDITFGNNLYTIYTLNSEITAGGNQSLWLQDKLNTENAIWKSAQYHKPMRPHVGSKSEGNDEYNNWSQLFYDFGVDLVYESDSHDVKTTYPVKPCDGSANCDEGFEIDNENGTVYVGEGCWGAPLRTADDNKAWTRDSGSFNQFKWITVTTTEITVKTIMVDNAESVGENSNNEIAGVLPENTAVWNPANGDTVVITNNIVTHIAAISASQDSEEAADGSIDLTSSDLEFVYDGGSNQAIGIEFSNVTIPEGATITNAYIQFTADASDSDDIDLLVSVEDTGNALPLTNSSHDVTSRSYLNSVLWSPDAWSNDASGEAERTSDITNAIQTVVAKSSWSNGNSIVVKIEATAEYLNLLNENRRADSVEEGNAAVLRVEYTESPNEYPVVEISSHEDFAYIENGNNISFTANATDTDGSIEHVEFFVDDISIGLITTAPYAISETLSNGVHELKVTTQDDQGGKNTKTITLFIGEYTTSLAINASVDAEQQSDGSMELSSSDLEFVYDASYVAGNQVIGIEFGNVIIPKGATITSAYIQFTADATDSEPLDLLIAVENNPNPETINDNLNNVTSRTYLTPQLWTPDRWDNNSNGEEERSLDLSTDINTVISHDQWEVNNAIVVKIEATDEYLDLDNERRRADSADEGNPPVLHITYEIINETLHTDTVQQKKQEVSLYPIPASDVINIKSNTTFNTAQFYTLTGKFISTLQVTNASIDSRSLSSGIYIVKLINTNTNTTSFKKVIIK
ncbi:fibronectin type III domain-containing protein [Bizionia sp. KMM 8389]